MGGKRLAAERDLMTRKYLVWHGAMFTMNPKAPSFADWMAPPETKGRTATPDLSIETFDRLMGLGE